MDIANGPNIKQYLMMHYEEKEPSSCVTGSSSN
jgi:hypothetical protein